MNIEIQKNLEKIQKEISDLISEINFQSEGIQIYDSNDLTDYIQTIQSYIEDIKERSINWRKLERLEREEILLNQKIESIEKTISNINQEIQTKPDIKTLKDLIHQKHDLSTEISQLKEEFQLEIKYYKRR